MAKANDEADKGRAGKAPAVDVTPPEQGRGDWWMGPDGAPFGSAEEYMKTRGEYMHKNVFTDKSMKLAEERRTFETDRQRFDLDRVEKQQLYAALDAKSKEYESFDRLVKERPAVYRQLQGMLKNGPGPTEMEERMATMFEEKYGEQLSELQRYNDDQESTRLRTEAFAALKGKYPDFDGDAVEKSISELTGKLQDGDMGYLAERLYLAGRGQPQDSPEPNSYEEGDEIQELMSSSGDAPSISSSADETIDQAQERALREMGV